jgi:SSS family solute:Na+ symporter
MLIDNVIIGVYLLIILLVGCLSCRKVKDLEEFSVASRSYPAWMIFATLSASFIGGGFSTGNAEKVFLFGIANIAALWGFSLKEMLVAKFIAPRADKFATAISTGDIMREAYGKAGQVVTGFFSVLLCAGIVGAQVGAMGIVFNVFMGIEPLTGILIGCGIVIAYSTMGGMRAIVLTDVIQFFVLGIGIPVALILGVVKAGGPSAVINSVPASHFAIPASGMTIAGFVSLFLTFLLGETLVPPYVQRLFIGKSAKHTARGTWYSGWFSIPFFAITGLMGLVALSLKPDLDPNLAMPYVIKEALPLGLRGVVVAGVISIVMSSADSFLNGASTGFVKDIVMPLRREPLEPRTQLILAKLVNAGTGILAVVFAIRISSILDILILAYNFWAPIILVPLAAVLLGAKTSRAGFIAGAIGGIVSTLAWNAFLQEVTGVDGLVIGVFCNLALFSLGNRFSRKDSAHEAS